MLTRISTLATVLLACFSSLFAQDIMDEADAVQYHRTVYPIEQNAFSFDPPPPYFEPSGDRGVVISVNYTGFNATQMIAFDYAADIWAANLDSDVPIIVNATMTNLGGGVLGSAGPVTFLRNFSGSPISNTWYPIALANKLAGFDLSSTQADISCNFNNTTSWYYGTDGNTPGGQWDFITVVLHELGHGLGFSGSASVSGGLGFIQSSGDPFIYDTFVEENDGTDVLSYTSGTVALADALTSNQLYWNGANGMIGAGGTRPRMYAPSTWSGGSSFSHLNEGTYNSGSGHALMTPFISAAEANHDPGSITYGIMEDMGWCVGQCNILSITPTTQSECNSATNLYTQTVIIEYEFEPGGGLLNINGLSFPFVGSPQTQTIPFLVADGQPVTVTAFFTSDPSCTFTAPDLFTAPVSCCEIPRLTYVDLASNQVTLHNYGSCNVDLTSHQLCSEFDYETISNMNLISGSLDLAPGADVVVEWTTWIPDMTGTDLSLYIPSATFTNPDHMLDFTQWTSFGNGRESVAVAKGIWTVATFVSGVSPYFYIGDGTQDGEPFWDGTIPPCSIDSNLLGLSTACDPNDNSYTQEIAIEYTTPPASGDLVVNGQNFPIFASIQLVTLVGLDSDGLAHDLVVSFSDEPTCTVTFSNAYISPSACDAQCPADLNSDGITDVLDLLLFIADMGCTGVCLADLNQDGDTDVADILLFLPEFGVVCP